MTEFSYVGRFAPSPSGALHFGSLVAALGSYLRAKSETGLWRLRIEDIDPPRELQGAADDILQTLDCLGLHWDGELLYQSQRLDFYQTFLEQLLAQNEAYFCQCTRKKIRAAGGIYNGHCSQLAKPLVSGAMRIRNHQAVAHFSDNLMGLVKVEQEFASEDFIIKRSDGLYAYQLAVVLDDAYQGVTEVVRGADLLESTVRQISLYRQFNLPEPAWLHLPLASVEPGLKLSKQNHATPINKKQPQLEIQAALRFLGQDPVDMDSRVEVMLKQAVEQFSLAKIPTDLELLVS